MKNIIYWDSMLMEPKEDSSINDFEAYFEEALRFYSTEGCVEKTEGQKIPFVYKDKDSGDLVHTDHFCPDLAFVNFKNNCVVTTHITGLDNDLTFTIIMKKEVSNDGLHKAVGTFIGKTKSKDIVGKLYKSIYSDMEMNGLDKVLAEIAVVERIDNKISQFQREADNLFTEHIM